MRNVNKIVSNVNRRKLRNNTQRALLSLLAANGEWVLRTQIRVPSVGSRLRDLRKDEFGGFDVQCATANALSRQPRSRTTRRPTFYRINPSTVTAARIARIFEGVV